MQKIKRKEIRRAIENSVHQTLSGLGMRSSSKKADKLIEKFAEAIAEEVKKDLKKKSKKEVKVKLTGKLKKDKAAKVVEVLSA